MSVKIEKSELINFLDYLQYKIKDYYKQETKIAIDRFLEDLKEVK